MFRFFRKIRYKLLDEGHLGKYSYYAIGEILLVVIGILLALQINDWQIETNDRKLEQDYLVRLYDDMSRSYDKQSQEIKAMKDAAASLLAAIKMLIDKNITDKSRSEFESLFDAAFDGESLSHNMTTIRQILDANHLSVFQSSMVRQAITNNSLRYELVSGAESTNANVLYRNSVEDLLEHVSIYPDTGQLLTTNEELIDNPLIHRKLHMISRMQKSKAVLYERMRERTKELRDMVKAELDKKNH